MTEFNFQIFYFFLLVLSKYPLLHHRSKLNIYGFRCFDACH